MLSYSCSFIWLNMVIYIFFFTNIKIYSKTWYNTIKRSHYFEVSLFFQQRCIQKHSKVQKSLKIFISVKVHLQVSDCGFVPLKLAKLCCWTLEILRNAYIYPALPFSVPWHFETPFSKLKDRIAPEPDIMSCVLFKAAPTPSPSIIMWDKHLTVNFTPNAHFCVYARAIFDISE